MQKMIFLNVGSMSAYSGKGPISGGGAWPKKHGYGHEMLNFKPFAGRMYGTAPVRPHDVIKVENLGAAKGKAFVDDVLVVWVAKSCIVGWYKNARVYRRSQPPPKGSRRSYKGDPIHYRATAAASDCTLLDPDNRHFRVPRARERAHGMGRYVWYADGPSNQAFRLKVLKYVAAGGDISAVVKAKRTARRGVPRQPDPQKRAKVEQAAIRVATLHFRKLNYLVDSVEGDNVGWDLNATQQQTGVLLRLEAKGLSGKAVTVELTPNEYKAMKKHKQTYRICVVTNCLKKSQRQLAVFQYDAGSRMWIDGEDRPLQISPMTSARLSC